MVACLHYRWLQAAQDFREQQDQQESGKLRDSYKIRLGKRVNIFAIVLTNDTPVVS